MCITPSCSSLSLPLTFLTHDAASRVNPSIIPAMLDSRIPPSISLERDCPVIEVLQVLSIDEDRYILTAYPKPREGCEK